MVFTLANGDPHVLLQTQGNSCSLPSLFLDNLPSSLASTCQEYLRTTTGIFTASPKPSGIHEFPPRLLLSFRAIATSSFTNADCAQWCNLYHLLPWEDVRHQEPPPDYDPTSVEERLLSRNPQTDRSIAESLPIIARALAELRRELLSRPAIPELCPRSFSLTFLQQVIEAFLGVSFHPQNFRRTVLDIDLVEPTGITAKYGTGRPSMLYQFSPSRSRRGLAVPRRLRR